MPHSGGLERRAAGWVDAGILSADQRRQILDFEAAAADRGHRLVAILAVLGAGLVTLGLVLVISQNWDEIGRAPKLATGIALLLACQGGGYWVRNGPLGLVRTGEALLLLGTGVLLGNLALISQQYHIALNPAPLLLPVLCSALAFAYLFSSRSHAFVAAVLFAAWLIAESRRGGSPLEAASETLLLLLLGAGAWLVALAALQRRGGYASLSPPAELVGGILIAGSVYLLGFYRHFDIESAVPIVPAAVLLLAPLALVLAALLATGARAEARLGWPPVGDRRRPPLLLGQLTLLLLLAWTLAAALNPRGEAEEAFILITLGYWLGACLLAGAITWLGLALRRESWVNAALVFLGLFILSRYFDLFSDYAQTGALFAGAGALFLVLAFLIELGRRRLRPRMDAPAGGTQVGG